MEDRAHPILIDRAVIEQVESFKFLGVNITNKLTCSKHTKTVVKRARQSLFPLRRLKKLAMGSQISNVHCVRSSVREMVLTMLPELFPISLFLVTSAITIVLFWV